MTNKSELSNRWIVCQFILLYFFIHIVIYSSHNYRETITKETFQITTQQFSFIEMISVIKLGGAIFSTYISQKYIRPLAVTLISSVTFIATLCILIKKMFANQYANLLIGCLHIMSDSSILPTIDAACLALLNERNISYEFGKIRVFSTAGHSITYLINTFIQRIYQDKKISPSVLINTSFFGGIFILCLAVSLLTLPYKEAPVAEKPSSTGEKKSLSWMARSAYRNVLFVLGVFNTNYTILILCALGSGISRSSLQSYLSEYLIETGSIRGDQGYIYFVRTVFELFVWSIVIWVGDRVSLEGLLPLGISLGALRSLTYAHMSPASKARNIVPYIAELFKSAYSALFIYVSIRLAHKYAPESKKTIAQGMLTGMYSGLSPSLAGIISYHVFSNTAHSDVENKKYLFKIAGCLGMTAAGLSCVLYAKKNRKSACLRAAVCDKY
ncbi:uncharacterized protein NEMAJ01_0913 [Nematocida major]|uniref:uncharacterized protein n=1 Tax=Nematocida major TaxID=1912982 RepID=UPI0020078594|nr:uncharacterized protein NEMAJ01_0913 [Nematocida major]KAH9386017.1 hypothetical protein NEMAJ01_0913 [Nematocida major]